MPDLTGPTPLENPPEGWREAFGEDPFSSWRGWDEEGTEGARAAYGIEDNTNKRAWILTPGRIEVVDGVIPTDYFNLPLADSDPELGGWSFIDADNDTTDGMQGLDIGTDLTGEGMRGANAWTDDEGEFEGSAQSAVKFDGDTYVQTLSYGTMGLGFVNLSTTQEGYSETSKMYYNYSVIGAEPKFRGTADDISMPGNSIKFKINNPFDYSEDESNAIRGKFGWDPTLGTGRYTQPYKDGFDRSITKIVKALITTYPINLATFPRTPPMKTRRKELTSIGGRETRERRGAPSGTEATVSTLGSDY